MNEYIDNMKSLMCIIDPHIYTTKFKERSGELSILGKATVTLRNGLKKLIGVYIGKASKFDESNESIMMDIAKQKIREKMRTL